MPILVQWEWKEKTKSFLVIFHFFDDYSNPNLRIRNRPGSLFVDWVPQKKAWMTWSPSHVELGLLGELLRYANIVNGLRESEKRELRNALEGISAKAIDDLSDEIPASHRRLAFTFDEKEPYLIVQLCSEYVDYLRKLLKPYLSG